MRFDEEGFLIPQKIKYIIDHEEEVQENLDKYTKNKKGYKNDKSKK